MRTIILLFLLLPFVSAGQIPGCVPIRGEYLWMSETEVSNRYYHEFLSSISNEDSIKHLPKSIRWAEKFTFGEPMQKYYFRHPAYADYPLVNITYDDANAYCEWLTSALNESLSSQKILVRLPTEKEWEDAARAGNKYAFYPWGSYSMRIEKGKHQGKMQANFVRGRGDYLGVSGRLNEDADITAPVTSYWPNGFGLYNMSGNVSEMVSEKGLVKGGSWRNRADWLRIEKQQYVYSASPEVGFRYVVEIVELPKPKKKAKPLTLNKKFFKNYFSVINDTLSIGKYEVTNKLYNAFVSESKEISKTDREKQSENWNNIFPYSQLYAINYHAHEDYESHPAVNISYKEALLFCSWLKSKIEETLEYKVEIRLPKEQEWEYAARGGIDQSIYPWGGPYLRNSKGCFLANHNPKMSEDENVNGYDTLSLNNFFKSHFTDLNDFDGEAVLAPVDSYFPNQYGLFNMSGNAAEMLSDSNFTKGGSWKSKSYFLQISSRENWQKEANPFTGVRVVMIRKKP